jgi:hypothetical protein
MNLTNDTYIILISGKTFTERYYRDKIGWLKVSARGRTFRMTAEQVLNHVLPALAGIKQNLAIKVEHHDPPPANERSGSQTGCQRRNRVSVGNRASLSRRA